MILDHLQNWERYAALHEAFTRAFEFLQRDDLAELPAGRHDIDGDNVYAAVLHADGRGRDAAKLEAHRAYIDIQFCLSGADEIGWKPAAHCRADGNGYDEAEDIEFFTDSPQAWSATPAGTFAVFFPADAHAPLAGEGAIHKVIVKVAETPQR